MTDEPKRDEEEVIYTCAICDKELQHDDVVWYEELDGIFISTCSEKHQDVIKEKIYEFAYQFF